MRTILKLIQTVSFINLVNSEVVKKEDNFKSTNNVKKLYKFDEWVKENSKVYMFDNDLLYETYFYSEDSMDKESRLRELWINSMKNSIDLETEELTKLNESISEIVRNLRRRIDQGLIKMRKHPVFGSNYRFYEEEEFMLDAEIEFHKIKKFLQEDSSVIKKDPEIGYRYEELLQTLKRKKIIEKSVPMFGAEHINDYYDKHQIDQEEEEEKIDMEDLLHEKIGSAQEQMKKVTNDYESEDFTNAKNMNQVEDKITKAKEKIISEFEGILEKQNLTSKKKTVKSSKGKKDLMKQMPKERKK
jgi:hypothetical protein